MIRLALVIVIAAYLCVPCIAATAVNDVSSEVPFSFEKGLVIVKAKIKKDVLVEVVIATGAQYSIADSELLVKYKVPLDSRGAAAPPILMNDLYGPIRSFISVPDVSVGPARTSGLSMGEGSTLQLSKAAGREIFAVLGADFLKGRVVQVDFKNRVIRFFDHSLLSEPSQEKDEATFLTPKITLPMIDSDDPLHLNLPDPVVVKAAFNGKTVKILLNTGMVGVIALSSSTAKKLGLRVPTEKSSPVSERIESLRLGTYELKDVPVVVSTKGTNMDQTLEQHGAAAGSLFLQNFIITFDFRHKVVILEHI